MAVVSYKNKEGKLRWRATAHVCSKRDRSIRVQRWVSDLPSQEDAKRVQMRLYRECERELVFKETHGAKWGEVIDRYESLLRNDQNVTRNTREDYVRLLRKLSASWLKRSAASITRADVREKINELTAEGVSPSLQNRFKSLVGRVFTFGIESRLINGIANSPTLGIRIAKAPEKRPEILNIAEIRMLLSEARRREHPWYPVWAVALLTGMRNGELYALLWQDIDWENRLINVNKSYNARRRCVKSTKAGYWRDVPISSELESLLKEIRAEAVNRPEVLPRFWQWTKGDQARILRPFCKEIGISSVKFHALRACFATQLIRNGTPPIQVQKICGWKDLETMQRYIRLAGIEIKGATEGLQLLPEPQINAQVVNLFDHKSTRNNKNKD